MIKDRIIHFIDFKGITKNKFYVQTGFANGFLDKGKDIGAKKIEEIYYTYPEINLEWLITGKGEMLKAEERSIVEDKPIKDDNVVMLELINQNKDLVKENGALREKIGRLTNACVKQEKN